MLNLQAQKAIDVIRSALSECELCLRGIPVMRRRALARLVFEMQQQLREFEWELRQEAERQ